MRTCSILFFLISTSLASACAGDGKGVVLNTSSLPPAPPITAPALRNDGRVLGRIVESQTKLAGELGMKPADMPVYIVKVLVVQSEHSVLHNGQLVSLYSWITPLDGTVWMNVATYSSKPAWIVGY